MGVCRCRPRARPSPTRHLNVCARHDRDDDEDHAESLNQDRDYNRHDQHNRTGPLTSLPKAHCARATTGTKPKRRSDGRGRGGAVHGGDGVVRRSHAGAVARARWQRRRDGAAADQRHSAQHSRNCASLTSLLLGYAGGGGGESGGGEGRARAALWSAAAAVAFAAATCSPSGGGASGGASSTRHRALRLRAVRRRYRHGGSKKFSAVGFVFRARLRHGRPGLGAQAKNRLGKALGGRNSGSII